MAAVRRVDTTPERAVRSALHRRGLRFRKDLGLVVGGRRVRPDIVFTRLRLAVFIDGCFWHCCPEHGRLPKHNTGYWSPKLQRNVERDQEQSAALQRSGWSIIRAWEHQHPDEISNTVVLRLSELAEQGQPRSTQDS